MVVIPDIKMLENSTVTDSAGATRPVFETFVDLGYFTPEDKLGYTVELKNMTSRSLDLQIHFEKPSYVTMNEEPEVFKVRINSNK